jgi:cytochrome oxidase Cu insertion factor (SCO1/SenC/PrrC family)
LTLLFVSCTQREVVPPLSLETLDGSKVSLNQFKGKKVVLYVWSRTCVGHSEQLKLLNELAEKRKDLYIISYAVAMVREDVVKSYRDIGISPKFITVLDPEVKFNEYYRIVFLPSTYLFDEKGRFIKVYPGLPKDIFSNLNSSSSNSFLLSSIESSGLTLISLPAKNWAFVKG